MFRIPAVAPWRCVTLTIGSETSQQGLSGELLKRTDPPSQVLQSASVWSSTLVLFYVILLTVKHSESTDLFVFFFFVS